MKKLITICCLTATVFTSQAQEKQKDVCDCPEPEKVDLQIMCRLNKDKTRAMDHMTFDQAFEIFILNQTVISWGFQQQTKVLYKNQLTN